MWIRVEIECVSCVIKLDQGPPNVKHEYPEYLNNRGDSDGTLDFKLKVCLLHERRAKIISQKSNNHI